VSERDPLVEAHKEIERLREKVREAYDEIRRLRIAIHGDPDEGIPGLRGRLSDIERDVDDRISNISRRLDEAQVESDRLRWRLSMVSGTLKWLGPSGVMLIIGFLVYVFQSAPA
jgi:hypothetical protein